MARVEGVSAGSEGGERDETAVAAAGSEVGTGMVRGMERAAEAGRVARELENLPSRGNFCDQDGDCPCHREGTCRVGKDFLARAVDCTAVALRSGSSRVVVGGAVGDGLECGAAGSDAAGADCCSSCCFDEA